MKIRLIVALLAIYFSQPVCGGKGERRFVSFTQRRNKFEKDKQHLSGTVPHRYRWLLNAPFHLIFFARNQCNSNSQGFSPVCFLKAVEKCEMEE